MTRFVDVSTMSRLVQEIGLPRLIGELADYIQSDFIHWPEFDKCARVANHSEIGVIELMPVSNAKNYAFKYVNGHPNNTRQGLYTHRLIHNSCLIFERTSWNHLKSSPYTQVRPQSPAPAG